MNKHKRPHTANGFSIIELSVIIAIFSIFVVNAFLLNDSTKNFSKIISTYEKLEIIKDTLSKHVKRFGHYPCPADGELPLDNADLGKGSGSNRPDPNQTPKCGIGPLTGVVPVNFEIETGGDPLFNVAMGVVPVKELGLPLDFMFDEWGNRIGYGVVDHLTSSNSYQSTKPGELPPGAQLIRIINENGAITNRAAYVLISYGENSYGAYGYDGGSVRIPVPDLNAIDAGEARNHHLDDQTIVNTGGAPNGNFNDDFDNEFFVQTLPIPNPDGNLILYDDILAWSEQEDTDFDFMDFQTPNSPVDFTPEQIPGLVLWLDGNDCDTVFGDNGLGTPIQTNPCTETTGSDTEVAFLFDKINTYNNITPNHALSFPGLGVAPVHRDNGMGNKKSIEFRRDNGPGFYDVLAVGNMGTLDATNFNIFLTFQRQGPDTELGQTIFSNSVSIAGAFGTGYGLSGLGTPPGGFTSDQFGFWANTLDPANVALANANAQGTSYVYTIEYDGINNIMRIYNGCNLEIEQDIDPTSIIHTPADVFYFGVYSIASAPAEGAFNGQLGEVVMYNGGLHQKDKARVVNYLSDKWLGTTGGAPGCGIFGVSTSPTVDQCSAPPITKIKGVGCADGNECCSGFCVGGTCCIPKFTDLYNVNTGSLDRCETNADCCDPLAACTMSGLCWRP